MAPLRGWAPRGKRLDRQGPARPLENDDLPGRAAPRSHRCALASRRPDQRRELPNLCRAGPRPDAARPATSSSWTISAVTRARPCARLIRSAGAKLFFLPKYSPDLNPIEQVFAKLKHLLEKPPHAPSKPSAPPFGELASEHSVPEVVRHLLQELRAMLQPDRASALVCLGLDDELPGRRERLFPQRLERLRFR